MLKAIRVAASLAAVFVLTAALAGCDDRPKRVSVEGVVLLDGEPLTQGQLVFVPAGGRPSNAKIRDDGTFELRCYGENDGALLGTHRVAVSAKTVVSEDNVKWHAPRRYANYVTSGLTVEVTESVDDLVIELTSDEEKARGGRK